MKHVLAISTIYPNPASPAFGGFVARSLEGLAQRRMRSDSAAGPWRVSVVNPIGLPPLGLASAVARYKALNELEERDHQGGVDIYRPRFTLIPRIGARRNASAIAKAALPIVRAIHAETPIDLLDAEYFFPDGPAAAIIARELGLPLSIKARGSDINYWGELSFARTQILEAAQQAAGLLSVSRALAREMVTLGMPRDKITVHYTGLDRDRFRPLDHTQLRSQLGSELGIPLPDNAPLFACVGALNHRKGHDIAIRALDQLSTDYPEARLLLVGKGDEAADLVALAKQLGLATRVCLTGSVNHNLLPLILSAADVMVLPTQSEGLANAWVEAIACGTPIVTSDVGGARELVTSDITGRLVKRTPEAVAKAIRSILSNPPDPQDVAASVEHFDWVTHAEKLAEYFDSLT